MSPGVSSGMKILPLGLVLLGVTLASCDRNPGAANSGGKLLSTDETRQVAMHILLNRYPEAQIVSQREEGQNWSYRFSTNGTTVPESIVVDRKARKAHFEKVTP